MGNPGLVARIVVIEAELRAKAEAAEVARIAKAVEQHDRKLWFGWVLATAIWAAIIAFKDQIFGK
jgi:uncharacterized membrane protein